MSRKYGSDSWRQVKLREICEQITDGKHGDCTNEQGSGFYFLSAKDVVDGKLLYESARQITEADFLETHKRTKFEPFDILFTNSGTIGRMAIAKDEERTHQTTFQKSVAILKPRKSVVEPYFLYYLLLCENERLINFAGGTAQKNLLLKDLREFPVGLPDLTIQQKIAAILSAYDALIENNTRRIQILEEMARDLYREWFVNFRFPGHEKVKMVESELGPIPEGWQVKRLSELVKTQYGYTESAQEDEVGPKYVRGTDINKTSYILWDTVPYCPINESDYTKYKLAVGDILVIRMADPGKVGIIEKNVDAVFASYLIRLHIRSNLLSPYYLFYFLSSDHYQNYVTGVSTGTTRKSASAGVITDIEMVIPPADIRERFEGQISAIRQMLNNLLDKNANLCQARDLLLHLLISREVEVSELDILTEGLEP